MKFDHTMVFENRDDVPLTVRKRKANEPNDQTSGLADSGALSSQSSRGKGREGLVQTRLEDWRSSSSKMGPTAFGHDVEPFKGKEAREQAVDAWIEATCQKAESMNPTAFQHGRDRGHSGDADCAASRCAGQAVLFGGETGLSPELELVRCYGMKLN